jgi:sortase A
LILGGAVLLFLGVREVVDSWLGQREAERAFERSRERAARDSPTAPPRPFVPDLGPAMARLSVPRLNSAWFVFPGVDKKSLRLGPGHLTGTALPGTEGNCVIAAHRDTHFRALKDVKKGDEILVTTLKGEFRYRVTKISIVSPKNTAALRSTSTGVLNLITCYPFYYVGSAPRRFIVEANFEGPVQDRRRPS